jgi:hypothetical protein
MANVMDAHRHLSSFQNEYHIFKNEKCVFILGVRLLEVSRGISYGKCSSTYLCGDLCLHIYLYLLNRSINGNNAGYSRPLYMVKEFHSNFIVHHQQSILSLGQRQLSDKGAQEPGLDTFPPDLMPHSSPVKQHIVMSNSHPEHHPLGQIQRQRNPWSDLSRHPPANYLFSPVGEKIPVVRICTRLYRII